MDVNEIKLESMLTIPTELTHSYEHIEDNKLFIYTGTAYGLFIDEQSKSIAGYAKIRKDLLTPKRKFNPSIIPPRIFSNYKEQKKEWEINIKEIFQYASPIKGNEIKSTNYKEYLMKETRSNGNQITLEVLNRTFIPIDKALIRIYENLLFRK